MMDATWKVVKAPERQPGLLTRLLARFRRREPTVYQRCLAVHIHFASGGAR